MLDCRRRGRRRHTEPLRMAAEIVPRATKRVQSHAAFPHIPVHRFLFAIFLSGCVCYLLRISSEIVAEKGDGNSTVIFH